jgi:hypothetical protein
VNEASETRTLKARLLLGTTEMDDVDEALMIIEAANAHHEKANPYAPVLEIVTYDLSTITTFGTPEAFLKEVAKLEQYVLFRSRWLCANVQT